MHHSKSFIMDCDDFDLFDCDEFEDESQRHHGHHGHGHPAEHFARNKISCRDPIRHDKECPPSPPQQQAVLPIVDADPHVGRVVVTPEFKPKAIAPVPHFEPADMNIEYRRTLHKLATYMRRSDQTRSIVKRQRSDHGAYNFFESERWIELEQNRGEIKKIIHYETATRTVF